MARKLRCNLHCIYGGAKHGNGRFRAVDRLAGHVGTVSLGGQELVGDGGSSFFLLFHSSKTSLILGCDMYQPKSLGSAKRRNISSFDRHAIHFRYHFHTSVRAVWLGILRSLLIGLSGDGLPCVSTKFAQRCSCRRDA